MTPEQKTLVQETWRQVAPIADTAACLFYGRLFAIDPSTRPLFAGVDLAKQREKLIRALTATVAGLDRLDELLPALSELGRRHVGYGVTDAHYDSVGEAFLWTLEQGLGEAWTAEARAAWTEAYGAIAGTMRAAAEAANDTAVADPAAQRRAVA